MISSPIAIAPAPVFIVDDEPETLFSYSVMLRKSGFHDIVTIDDSRDFVELLPQLEAGVVVLDLQMPHLSGREVLVRLQSECPHVPVVIVTAANELETAVDCMRCGAFDYIVKPIEPIRFLSAVTRATEMTSLRGELAAMRESLASGRMRNEGCFARIVTRSSRMKGLFVYVEAIAPTAEPVLVTGETGVGKELFARAVHDASGRSGSFVALNSAGLDDTMFSDTLFGHKRGAFTGAGESREGMVSRAAGGTLFLDEIGDLNAASQVKLLRLIQEREYIPLGSDLPAQSRARIVVATNYDLDRLTAEGRFRKDLYYRLCAHHIRIPPLRERREDIPLLLELFLQQSAEAMGKRTPAYPPDLVFYLAGYDFPGNVRELKGMVADAVARHAGGILPISAFGKAAAGAPRSDAAGDNFDVTGRMPTLREMEAFLVERALRMAGGNQGAAAQLLGISRQALNKRLTRR